jgi:hypothetical protein
MLFAGDNVSFNIEILELCACKWYATFSTELQYHV